MPLTFTRIVSPFVLVAVSLTLAAEQLHHPWLTYGFKPLATALILSIALVQYRQRHSAFALWISIGLVFSLFGDVFLMLPIRFFSSGLVSFLMAHVAYLIAFSRDVKLPARFTIFLLYFAVFGRFCVFLFPTLPPQLRLAIVFYIFFVSSMAAQAMGRFLILRSLPAASAAIGTFLFLLSDTILSYDRFHAPLPGIAFAVLIPYYLGQWLIALSTLPDPRVSSALQPVR